MNHLVIGVTGHDGYLHIGLGENSKNSKICQQIGLSINSYNNIFTRTFAKLRGTAEEINISGKLHYVEKKSFRDHLGDLKVISPDQIEQLVADVKTYGYSDAILAYFNQKMEDGLNPNEPIIPFTNESLGDALSEAQKNRYLEKAMKAIDENDEQKAVYYVHKGADLNKIYYVKGERARDANPNDNSNQVIKKINPFTGKVKEKSFWADKEQLESELQKLASGSYYCSYTLLAAAKEKGFNRLANLIESNHTPTDRDAKVTYYYQFDRDSLTGKVSNAKAEYHSNDSLAVLEAKPLPMPQTETNPLVGLEDEETLSYEHDISDISQAWPSSAYTQPNGNTKDLQSDLDDVVQSIWENLPKGEPQIYVPQTVSLDEEPTPVLVKLEDTNGNTEDLKFDLDTDVAIMNTITQMGDLVSYPVSNEQDNNNSDTDEMNLYPKL